MKFFKTSRGYILSFGFDVWNRKPDPRRIHYSDMLGENWQPGGTHGSGDFISLAFNVVPEFIHETRDGTVVAYLPGKCIELTPTLGPDMWRARVLAPEETTSLMASGDVRWPASNMDQSPLLMS